MTNEERYEIFLNIYNQKLSSWGFTPEDRVNLVDKYPLSSAIFLIFSISLASTVFWICLA